MKVLREKQYNLNDNDVILLVHNTKLVNILRHILLPITLFPPDSIRSVLLGH